jgi:uncharacterized tellurite resistance protein B-like protein
VLRALKRALAATQGEALPLPAQQRHHLALAVAVLVHEARRADYDLGEAEASPAEAALMDLLGVERGAAAALLEAGRAKAQELTSFYAPVTTIKRDWPLEQRIRLVEHLWRVSFADGQLSVYEDHYVRKIAHLLYVPNTQSMLARNRARG